LGVRRAAVIDAEDFEDVITGLDAGQYFGRPIAIVIRRLDVPGMATLATITLAGSK